MHVARLAVPLAALLLLGACDYFSTPTADSEGDASGEVLPGSIGDAMIPTDDLTSQPPALAIQPAEGGAATDDEPAAGSAATADSAAPEPAAETAPAEPEAAAE